MVSEHIAHHKSRFEEEKKMDDSFTYDIINLEIHVVGGFQDNDSTSSKISNWLMHLLAQIAEEEKDFIKMTLKTCALTSMNDNGYACPIGRGLGIDLRTGKAFLAKVEEDVAGPAVQLRSVRLWSGQKELSVVHTSKSNEVHINPFVYEPFTEANQLLQLPDHVMLQFTSTSPDVEEPNFCTSVRSTLRYLLDVECTSVFGPSVDQPLIFKRTGLSNSWKRTR
jgi:protein N-terminal asparagine amidohydrolase